MVDISSFSMIQFYLLVWKKWNKSKEKIQETLIIDAFADEKLTVLEVTTTIQTNFYKTYQHLELRNDTTSADFSTKRHKLLMLLISL